MDDESSLSQSEATAQLCGHIEWDIEPRKRKIKITQLFLQVDESWPVSMLIMMARLPFPLTEDLLIYFRDRFLFASYGLSET